MSKIALGIYLDGLIIKAALINQTDGICRVEQLESFKLFDSLEKPDENEDAEKPNTEQHVEFDENNSPFGLDFDVSNQDPGNIAQERGNIDVIIDLLSKMAPPRCPIAFNLHCSNVLYKNFHLDEDTRPSKIKKLIWKELNSSNEETISYRNISFIKSGPGTYLGMFHNDPLVFSNLLQEAFKLTRKRPSSIELIDTIEFSLAEYIWKTSQVSEDDRLAIVFFSQNFTKVFFMKGHLIETVLPTIHTGAKSKTICETAFSKMLYEFDFRGIDAPQTILLAGEVAQVKAMEFFEDKFPNLEIRKLDCDASLLSPPLQSLAGKTSSYNVAIALAMKLLLPKKARKYKQNFIPKRIKERQSQFVLAWHGFAMAGVIILTFLFLFFQQTKIRKNINKTKSSLQQIDLELAQLKDVERNVDSLRLEINNIEKGASLIDSLAQETTRWTPLIEKFSEAYKGMGFFTITHFESTTKEKMVVDLNLSSLDQVAKLERFINNSKVLNVKNSETEEFEKLLQLTLECDLSNQKYLESREFLSGVKKDEEIK